MFVAASRPPDGGGELTRAGDTARRVRAHETAQLEAHQRARGRVGRQAALARHRVGTGVAELHALQHRLQLRLKPFGRGLSRRDGVDARTGPDQGIQHVLGASDHLGAVPQQGVRTRG